VFLLVAAVVTAQGRPLQKPIVFSDSLYVFRVEKAPAYPPGLSRFIRNRRGGAGSELSNYLDSLGFHHAIWDTVAADTIVVRPGRRCVLDTILIRSAFPFTIDSLEKLRFPRPYDAGEIARLARRAIRLCAQNGFPFATLTIITGTNDGGRRCGGADSAAMKITFVVDTDRRCAFDSPLFIGEFKTRPRILARDIAFQRGGRFDVRLVEESEKRLLSRPYVAEAEAGAPGVVPVPPSPDSSAKTVERKADDTTAYVAVPFRIKDNSGMGLDGALAASSDRETSSPLVAGSLTLTLLNLFGTGEQASVYYRGEKGLQQFDITIAKPHLLKMPLVGSADFGMEIQEENYGYLHGGTELLLEFQTLWRTGAGIRGHEIADRRDGGGESWQYAGAELILQRSAERWRAGVFSKQLLVRTGAGVSDREGGRFQRWKGDFSAGFHLPVARRHAVAGMMHGRMLIADERDSLHVTELFRTGGHASVRGYAENEYAFMSVGYLQGEYHVYFSDAGSAYIFMDGGIGFSRVIDVRRENRTDMLGYGAGVRIPVKIGTASIAWARNYRDTRGFGRIHVRMQNAVSSAMGE